MRRDCPQLLALIFCRLAGWITSRPSRPARRSATLATQRSRLEDPGARVDAPGVGHGQRPVLSLQERSSDLTRPDDEVPQAIELPNDDVHLSVPRRPAF